MITEGDKLSSPKMTFDEHVKKTRIMTFRIGRELRDKLNHLEIHSLRVTCD